MAGEVVSTATEGALLQDDYSHAEPGQRHGRHHSAHSPSTKRTAMHSCAGTVSSIDAHSNGKHATIHVTHGKRKKDAGSGELVGYHRPSSSITIPKAAAKGYAIGQKVNAGISPAGEGAPPSAKAAPPKGKGKAPAKRRPRQLPPPSPIASAMQPSVGGGY